MEHKSTKQIMYEIADVLPNEATLNDAIYALRIRQKLEEGLADLAEDRVYTQEEIETLLLDPAKRLS